MTKHILHFFLILCGILSCRQQSTHGLFYCQELNERLNQFVTENCVNKEGYSFQVLVGNNRSGTKIDFVAHNGSINLPFFYFDPMEFELLGVFSIDERHQVPVYGCKGDSYKIMRKNSLSHRFMKEDLENDDGICSVSFVVQSYQLSKKGILTGIKSHVGCSYQVYRLIVEGRQEPHSLLVLNQTTNDYEMVLPDTHVYGTWYQKDSVKLSFIPDRLLLYSTAKNEMIEFPVSSISKMRNGNARELVSIREMRNYQDSLVYYDEEGYCTKWIPIPN